jgi:2-methylcitrate dehydratase
MDMHFKLGLYEHQSAGALEGVIKLLQENPDILNSENVIDIIREIVITAYEPAFGIIGDPAKKDPKTRQSADHSMVFIVSRLLKKAIEKRSTIKSHLSNRDALWKELILTPIDYSYKAIYDKDTRSLMAKIKFVHGGRSFDEKYPEGIPTQVDVVLNDDIKLSSGLIMFPSGHARNTICDLKGILNNKNTTLLSYAISDKKTRETVLDRLNNIEKMSNKDLEEVYNCQIEYSKESVDEENFEYTKH